jgi:hypothetical protein
VHFESYRAFAVPLNLVEQMVASDRAIIRIEMFGQFVEGDFSHNFMTFARPAFRKALKQIKA